MTGRNRLDDIKTGVESVLRDEPGGDLLTAQVVSGLKVARARFGLRCGTWEPASRYDDRSLGRSWAPGRKSEIPTALLAEDLNQFLRGWRQYYRFGNSTRRFAKIDRYVVDRMALLLSNRHGKRSRGYGLKLIIVSGNNLGIERLSGTIVYGRTAHAGGEGHRRAG